MENFIKDTEIWESPAFPQQSNPNEDIIVIVRQDISIVIIRFIATMLVFLFFLLIKFIAQIIVPPQLDFVLKIVDFLISFGGLGLLVSFLWFFHNFFLSLQLVTNDRIIDIDQKGIFKREVNELAVSNIQDVNYKQNGLLPSMLGYGDVVIKTGSIEIGSTNENTVNGFVFENCPEPARIAGIISDLFHKKGEDSIKQEAVTTADELRKVLQDVIPSGDIPNNLPTASDKTISNDNPLQSADEIVF